MDDHILAERPQAFPGVRIIRFNRPEKKNAITRAMYGALTDALVAAGRSDAVRVIVFLGSEGCFSAGNDMAEFAEAAGSGDMGPEIVGFLTVLAGMEKPVVSGIDGLAIGIGTTMHLHCDLTVASTRSVFRTPFTDLGLVPEAASSLLAPRIMGHQRAFALLALGEAIPAEEARVAGLIWKVVEPAAVEAETLKAAALLAAKPPEALRIARNLLRGDRSEILARIDEEAAHFSARLKSREARSAFEAFFRRRTS